MAGRTLACGLLCAALVASSTGCCVDRFNCNYGGCTQPDYACWDPCGLYAARECLTYWLLAPLTFFQPLFCGGGCGEVYYGPWVNDPPDCCDPCDPCGNWAGPGDSPQPRTLYGGPWSWHGRYASRRFGPGYCASCRRPAAAGYHGVALQEGEVIPDGPKAAAGPPEVPTRSALQPTPAAAPPITTTSAIRPYGSARYGPAGARAVRGWPFWRLWPSMYRVRPPYPGPSYAHQQVGYQAR